MPDSTIIIIKKICESHNEIISFNWKDIFPLISPVVVILLFAFERILNYKTKKKENDRTWYFKVLLDPNLIKIDIFFNSIKECYINSCKILEASQDNPHSSYNSLKSQEIGKFQKIKRLFELDVISPIIFRYPNVGDALTIILMDLEDILTLNLDNDKFTEDDIDSFSAKLSEKKSIWLNTLYDPIK